MDQESFATPKQAAVATFPARYVRVRQLEISRDGGEAKVSLLTNEEPYLYPYYVYCARTEDGRWVEMHSHN